MSDYARSSSSAEYRSRRDKSVLLPAQAFTSGRVDLGSDADTMVAMSIRTPVINNNDPTTLNAFLDERLYAFNASATGVDDGMPMHGIFEQSGQVVAGISGHTWGGCCEIVQLWVQEDRRKSGLGTALLHAAEAEARRRGCTQVTLSSHTFQAPGFYEKNGYERAAQIADYPRGHAKLLYVKRLAA